MTENDQAIDFLSRTGDLLYGRDWLVPLAREMEISPDLMFNWISRKTPLTMTDYVWPNVFYVLGQRGNRYQDFIDEIYFSAMREKTLAKGGMMPSRRHCHNILCLYEDRMTNQRLQLSEPMPEIMSLDEVAAKLKQAAGLLTNHGDIGADNALKTMLAGELRIWDFLWREKLHNLTDRAGHVLGDNHRAIVLVRNVLNIPWPIGLSESPDDPEES